LLVIPVLHWRLQNRAVKQQSGDRNANSSPAADAPTKSKKPLVRVG